MPSVLTLEGPRLRNHVVHSTRMLRDVAPVVPALDPNAVIPPSTPNTLPPAAPGALQSRWGQFVDWIWDNRVAAVATIASAAVAGVVVHCHHRSGHAALGGDPRFPADVFFLTRGGERIVARAAEAVNRGGLTVLRQSVPVDWYALSQRKRRK